MGGEFVKGLGLRGHKLRHDALTEQGLTCGPEIGNHSIRGGRNSVRRNSLMTQESKLTSGPSNLSHPVFLGFACRLGVGGAG